MLRSCSTASVVYSAVVDEVDVGVVVGVCVGGSGDDILGEDTRCGVGGRRDRARGCSR
jgi:hypothetical protein